MSIPSHFSATSPSTSDGGESFAWRNWIFGDFHADSHHFLESALERAPKEIACAGAAAALVSPLVSIIDKCIVQDISGTQQFFKAVKAASKEMVMTPRAFFGGRPFILTAAVYFGTYAVANLSELALDINRVRDDEKRKQIKVAASAAANISLLAWRDSIFAREFAAKTPVHAVPKRTIGLFASRDAFTMYATFYAAPVAAQYLQDEYGVERNVAELSTALALPVAAQFVTAPLHIHAMDYYARPAIPAGGVTRLATVGAEFLTVACARGFRILPAFGIGSFSNNKFREFFIRQENEELLLKRRITNIINDIQMMK